MNPPYQGGLRTSGQGTRNEITQDMREKVKLQLHKVLSKLITNPMQDLEAIVTQIEEMCYRSAVPPYGESYRNICEAKLRKAYEQIVTRLNAANGVKMQSQAHGVPGQIPNGSVQMVSNTSRAPYMHQPIAPGQPNSLSRSGQNLPTQAQMLASGMNPQQIAQIQQMQRNAIQQQQMAAMAMNSGAGNSAPISQQRTPVSRTSSQNSLPPHIKTDDSGAPKQYAQNTNNQEAYWARIEQMKAKYIRHLTLMIQNVERLLNENGRKPGLEDVRRRLFLLFSLLHSSKTTQQFPQKIEILDAAEAQITRWIRGFHELSRQPNNADATISALGNLANSIQAASSYPLTTASVQASLRNSQSSVNARMPASQQQAQQQAQRIQQQATANAMAKKQAQAFAYQQQQQQQQQKIQQLQRMQPTGYPPYQTNGQPNVSQSNGMQSQGGYPRRPQPPPPLPQNGTYPPNAMQPQNPQQNFSPALSLRNSSNKSNVNSNAQTGGYPPRVTITPATPVNGTKATPIRINTSTQSPLASPNIKSFDSSPSPTMTQQASPTQNYSPQQIPPVLQQIHRFHNFVQSLSDTKNVETKRNLEKIMDAFDTGCSFDNANILAQSPERPSEFLSYLDAPDYPLSGRKRMAGTNPEDLQDPHEYLICDENGFKPVKRRKKEETSDNAPVPSESKCEIAGLARSVIISTNGDRSTEISGEKSLAHLQLEMQKLQQFFNFSLFRESAGADDISVLCTLISSNIQLLVHVPALYPEHSAEYRFPVAYDIFPKQMKIKQIFEELILQHETPFSLLQLLRIFMESSSSYDNV